MKEKIIDQVLYWLKLAALALFLAFIIRGFIFIPMKVDGNSMAKTLEQGDQIVYEKFTAIKRFDVIIFKEPDGSIYIKRVIGMPGENVRYRDDQLFIDGEVVKEDFLGHAKFKRSSDHYTTNFDSADLLGTEKISPDAYFVLGDNRRLSKDSRSFGEVKEADVIGKGVLVYYPLKHFKIIP